MAGHLNGLAVRLQSEEHRMLHVHCMAHCLNLCLQDCSRNCCCIRDALDLTSELNSLIRASPKRLSLFHQLKNELSYSTPGLKPLCPTRWTVRTGALDAVIKNYAVICSELEQISKDSCGEPSRKASGLLALMEKFSTYYGLKLSFLVFSATEQLSKILQSSSITAHEAYMAVAAVKRFLQWQRIESSFDYFYRSVVEESKDLTMPPTLPRQKRIPIRINDGAPNHHFSTPEEHFRKQYYEVHDLITHELERRYEQESFQILQEIEDLLIKSCRGTVIQPSEKLKRLYSEDINFDNLKVQLQMLPDLVHTVNEQCHLGIKKVTLISTICEVLNSGHHTKVILNEVDRLLRIYLTVPMTTATAERTFSTLRRLKNYLHSTMTQKRLNNLIILHTHKDRTDNLDLCAVSCDFASANDHRQAVLWHFLEAVILWFIGTFCSPV